MGTEQLRHYLNEHLAGAASAVQLAERCRQANEGSALAGFLTRFLGDVEADRRVLQDLAARVGGRHRWKEAAGEVAERLGRVRLAETVTRDADLTRLLELEALLLGVTGKRALWRSLQTLGDHEELAALDLTGLVASADRQLAALEEHRRLAAVRALGSPETGRDPREPGVRT